MEMGISVDDELVMKVIGKIKWGEIINSESQCFGGEKNSCSVTATPPFFRKRRRRDVGGATLATRN